ncbi:hypothetical protein HC251_10105 [Iamia sp. SCSIO 61187]|uniref:hypothetical protein n=1 Tax=Iamia sp. SCSIO 61187 TaxID=2722752 RepID=UPI001C62B17C|nr:hypothetical protein [Iamia sp. SCSIO 61187]QYG92747.1 hypothetical protein HC251_10105 [Iamia sp. SCSIO 61187]
MKVLLALVAGALAGAAAIRLVRPGGPALSAGSPAPADPGPDRVAVDVSAFTD